VRRARARYAARVEPRSLLIRWVSNILALFVAAWLLSGVGYGDEGWTLVAAAAVFTLVNAWVKPVITILSIPFIVVTLGIFLFLINIGMLYLTAWIVSGFDIEGFWSGAGAAIVVSLVNALLSALLPDPKPR
jgi:putative membrane protein